ncbi:MAG: papain-like cysteine protease family protein [Mariniblastus sp.]
MFFVALGMMGLILFGATTESKIAFCQSIEVPFIQKKPDFGGEACVAMVLNALGHEVDQDFVFDCSRVDPTKGRGCTTKELLRAVKRIGFSPGEVWYSASDDAALAKIWQAIEKDLIRKIPTVVCRVQNGVEQFVLIVGFDPAKDEIVFHDPNQQAGQNRRANRSQFLRACQLAQARSADGKMFVRIPMVPDNLKVNPQSGFTDADFAQHIRKLKKRLPHDDFKIVLQKPFVVVGDGTMAQVKRAATGTVKWAVDAIKKDYFERDPENIIDVWLFKDSKSYQKHNLELFGEKPTTPYGYYSPSNRVLVMDISTGGGTLVHEIVHPFMESNFEECPSWFNEGLASLYEQSSSRDGHIIGLTNWRLRGLQLAIEDGRVPSFQELCTTTRREFYNGHATNYAQARYLCYYLQERGLLIKYFHRFRENVAEDPGGYQTLKDVLGRDDIEVFQKQWERYVSKLRYGR